MHSTMISANITAYSTAVGPSSLLMNLLMAANMTSTPKLSVGLGNGQWTGDFHTLRSKHNINHMQVYFEIFL